MINEIYIMPVKTGGRQKCVLCSSNCESDEETRNTVGFIVCSGCFEAAGGDWAALWSAIDKQPINHQEA